MNKALETGLPANLDAERFILGSVLLDDSRFVAVAGSVTSEDFMLEKHRRIFNRMSEINQRGEIIDRVTLANELMKHGELDSVDGISYIVSLDDGLPHLSNVDSYLKIIHDKSILRKTIYAAQSIVDRALSGSEDAAELLGQAESMLGKLGLESSTTSEFETPEGVIMSKGNLQNYLDRSRLRGVQTGFPQLDLLTCGMMPGELWILAAATSGGKSTFARNVARNAALAGEPGAFISLEVQAQSIVDGLICAQGQIDSQVIRRGMSNDRERTRNAAVIVSELPIYIRDKGTCTLAQLHAGLRKLKAEKGITWAIVDYLQLMSGTGRAENRTQEVSQFTRGMKLIAMDLCLPILALSQLKRTGDVQRRPMLQDLRESGTIEQDATVVLFLYAERTEERMDIYPTELILAKQREGEAGVVIQAGFCKSMGIFREIE